MQREGLALLVGQMKVGNVFGSRQPRAACQHGS